MTGASSALGQRLLPRLLADEAYTEIWCGVHRRDISFEHRKLHRLSLDLATDFSLDQIPGPLDLVVHFAASTHTRGEQAYWNVNFRGTIQLAEKVRALGCQRFFHISTRCANAGCGAYGESKRAAEVALQSMTWDNLVILRPAEVYGVGTEGIDKLLRLAARLHVVPLLWGQRNIQFAPLHVDDFVEQTYSVLANSRSGIKVLDLCGPESFDGVTLALRIARRYAALPLPVWWPGLLILLEVLRYPGWLPLAPDQLTRLVGPKTASRSSVDSALHEPTVRFPGRQPAEKSSSG